MTLTAHIILEHGTPWLTITSHTTLGPKIVTFDAPLNLNTKASVKREIDFAFERSGIPRPDLYDAIRLYQRSHQKRAA